MIGVITAVEAERDAILTKMQDVLESVRYGIEFYQGMIRHKPCITAMCGIGKVNAARCAQLMIDQFHPDRIVNIGSAGALYPEINIGDVVISTACIQHDVDLTAFGLAKGSLDDSDGFIQADQNFVKLCQTAMERSLEEEFTVYTGPIATGDQFNDSLDTKHRLYNDFHAYCVEMEGAAVAQVCAMCRIPFVIIRSISDKPDDETIQLYENYKKLASKRCADFVENLAELI